MCAYEEFTGGHVAGSLNIPLAEIPHRIQEIQELKQLLILFCASGNRSGQAQVFLTRKELNVITVLG
jgi:rhodanese-related sulfurtransferase